MRVILDTNVLVSAVRLAKMCAEVLELVLLDHDLIVGRNVVRELEEALREKVKLPVVRSTEIIDFVSSEAARIVDKAEPASVKVDAADALVLGEALASHADLFVTGDAALLRLAAIGALKIVSPRRFWEVLRAGHLLAVNERAKINGPERQGEPGGVAGLENTVGHPEVAAWPG